MSKKWTKTITAIAIHAEGDNPVFGETVTTISLEDDAAGFFLRIKRNDVDERNSLTFDPEELTAVAAAGADLVKAAEV